MNAALVNQIGLGLNIFGVAILFRWGPPQPNLEEGMSLGIEGSQVDEHNAQVRKLRQRHETMSRFGLGLVFIGFIGQLVATFLT